MKRQSFRLPIGFCVVTLVFLACGTATNIPGVHEPLDSKSWTSCVSEFAERDQLGLLDNLTMDGKRLICQGVVAGVEGRIDEAVELLTEAGVRNQDDHRSHYLMGRILTEAGRYDEALAAFERSSKRFPAMEVPAERLGRRVAEKDGDEGALRFLTMAMDRNVCSYGCMGLLAQMSKKTGDPTRGVSVYKKMISEKPGEPAAFVGLAAVRNGEGDFQAEVELLVKANKTQGFVTLNDSKKAEIWYSLAFAYFNLEDYAKAARKLSDAIEKNSSNADWHVLAGWIELRRGRPENALASFDRAKAKRSAFPAAYSGAGDALFILKRYDESSTEYQEARRYDPGSGTIVLKIARSEASAGRKDRARELVDEAGRLSKESLPPALLKEVLGLILQLSPVTP